MRVRIEPGGTVAGEAVVPGDKSIAHRWLILAATGSERSSLHGLPVSLDVRSTARCLAAVSSRARPSLEAWAGNPVPDLVMDGQGRQGIREALRPLDCGNSGTTMRLLAGLLAAYPLRTRLTGDASLARRPMERVAEPLRRMGASVRTEEGHPPVEVEGASLRGIRHIAPVPSAQVKGAVLLAGVGAEGETTVVEAVGTRDHTERALRELGAPVRVAEGTVTVSAFQHGGLHGVVPGDVSSAAFLLAAAAITGGRVTVHRVGLNPTRTAFLRVLERMGVRVEQHRSGQELAEPNGILAVTGADALVGTEIDQYELPLVIDEVPALAAVAAHAEGETRFGGAGELREKESDRLRGLADCLRSLGGGARVEGDDLVLAGGGLRGGSCGSRRDHRLAMALCVAALAAASACEVTGTEWASVSFPGFVEALGALGAPLEVAG